MGCANCERLERQLKEAKEWSTNVHELFDRLGDLIPEIHVASGSNVAINIIKMKYIELQQQLQAKTELVERAMMRTVDTQLLLKKVEDQLQAANERISNLTFTLEHNLLAIMGGKWTEEREKMQTELMQLRQEMVNYTNDVTDYERMLDTLHEQLTQEGLDHIATKQEVENLKDERDTLRAKLDAWEKGTSQYISLKLHQEDIDKQERTIDYLRDEVERLKAEVKIDFAFKNDLRREITKRDVRVQELERAIRKIGMEYSYTDCKACDKIMDIVRDQLFEKDDRALDGGKKKEE